MLKEYIEDVRVDALGSVMGIRRCGLTAPLLLLEAHIDEIGLSSPVWMTTGSCLPRRAAGWTAAPSRVPG